ncbi:zinc finger CCCH domain-containing protein 14 isoform X3 [Ascaphus truei]|uniref:zinc finger CCCH domain-containing protein 14 isoform X3 n=1 Tax=Ascaphus truei TaxID=8439 RepID=UPI003F592D4E
MEIGTEISRKIRTAIKGKLQELGAYVDEELPDYIMVMVANKKSQDQMTDDLSLFLGSNTTRFTTWLQGVLDKLRSVTSEPNSLKVSDAIIFESSMPSIKSLSGGSEDRMRDVPALTVSSTRQERMSSDNGSATRLTSAVKPLRELLPSEAIIDIKPDVDDLIDDDLGFVTENPLFFRSRHVATTGYRTSRPTAELYRPPGIGQHMHRATESSTSLHRLSQAGAAADKPLDVRSSRSINAMRLYDTQTLSSLPEMYRSAPRSTSARSSREDESLRKRKLPVASSVVKVKTFVNDGEQEDEDEDEEEEGYLSRTASISSSVSVPARPERRYLKIQLIPSLPPSKQANKNLILKAISEAQASVTKTTNYSAAAPQKQTVPVAPRTRLLLEEDLVLRQSRPSIISDQAQLEELQEQKLNADQVARHRMDLLSRLQADPAAVDPLISLDPEEVETVRPVDSRSFVLKRPKLSEEVALHTKNITHPPAPEDPPLPGRQIQPREVPAYEKPASPKFIVTLDGVPSPPGYVSDHEPEEEAMSFTEEGASCTETYTSLTRAGQNYPMQLLSEPLCSMDVDMERVLVPAKRKVPERCKFWPACKNADGCVFHHPTAPCKSFPKCRFADKCFFIHPNCKYDAKCTKTDCPYTHASRRVPVPPLRTVPVAIPHPDAQVCRFFPACRNTECSFYHPKHCRFNTQCTRPDCKFYHPSVSVPPRHALKWTRSQTSE